jgi:hypothetical protein
MRIVLRRNKIPQLSHIGGSYVSTIKTIASSVDERRGAAGVDGGTGDPGQGGDEILWRIPGCCEASNGSHKKTRRPRDRDATGIGCVLPKAGKRRDGARGSGANVPGSLPRSFLLPMFPSSCQFDSPSPRNSPRKLVRHERSWRPRQTPTFRHPRALMTLFTVKRNEHAFVSEDTMASAEFADNGIN